jgi:hypothetical protein
MEFEPDRDPLGVLRTTWPVVEQAGQVQIVRGRLGSVAEEIASASADPPSWTDGPHPTGRDDEETAKLVLVLDALNFCFWPVPNDSGPRWQVTWAGKTWDGYWALAAALSRGVAEGMPLTDARWLANLEREELERLLAGDPGTTPIPLIETRLAHLREVGRVLLERWDGSFLHLIEATGGSAPRLLRSVIEHFPSFRDEAVYQGRPVAFYKRAQILIADLASAFGWRGPGDLVGLEALTAFADYKVPQVLRRLGLIVYQEDLQERVRRRELLPARDPAELEIRAATIWAVELLRQELERLGTPLPAYRLDWALWQLGQTLPPDTEPYHRTLTSAY